SSVFFVQGSFFTTNSSSSDLAKSGPRSSSLICVLCHPRGGLVQILLLGFAVLSLSYLWTRNLNRDYGRHPDCTGEERKQIILRRKKMMMGKITKHLRSNSIALDEIGLRSKSTFRTESGAHPTGLEPLHPTRLATLAHSPA